MANAFGGFLHTSPLSNLTTSTSRPPNPHAALASNCVRDYFGPVVQTVADALQSRGPSTVSELVGTIRSRCSRDWNRERGRLVDGILPNSTTKVDDEDDEDKTAAHRRKIKAGMNKARGPESAGYITNPKHVQSALMVLLQHSLLKVTRLGGGGGGNNSDPTVPTTHYIYTFLPERARLLIRYPCYVQHVRDIYDIAGDNDDETKSNGNNIHATAEIVQCLLLEGRMMTENVIHSVWKVIDNRRKNSIHGKNNIEYNDNIEGDGLRYVVTAFIKLVESGYIEVVKPIATNTQVDNLQSRQEKDGMNKISKTEKIGNDDDEGGEYEFGLGEDGSIIVAPSTTENTKNSKKKENTTTTTKKKRSKSNDDIEEEEDGIDTTILTKKQKMLSKYGSTRTEIGLPVDDVMQNDIPAPTTASSTMLTMMSDNSSTILPNNNCHDIDDQHYTRIQSLLSTQRKLIKHGSIYRVNISMFHASLRAMALSRLVSEMYPPSNSNIKNETTTTSTATTSNSLMNHVGAIVKAALTYMAHQEHAPRRIGENDNIVGQQDETEIERHDRMSEWGMFYPANIVPYLSNDVVKALQSYQVGGMNHNVSLLLVQMSKLQSPRIAIEVEETHGHPKGGKFELCTRQLLQRMRSRVEHKILSSHHGIVAARIVSILQTRGHCESDIVADEAMIPARDAREILHKLHRDRYVDLFDMHMTKTHNTGTAIFLWDVISKRLSTTVIDNVCTALLNLLLRRQHEVEVGKEWMDRAKEAGATEENFHEEDMKKYQTFCMGLERLDRACLMLDETLMLLNDF